MNARLLGLVSGAAGGLVGLVAMRLIARAVAPAVRPRTPRPLDVFRTTRSISLIGLHHRDGEPPAEAVARQAYHLVRHHDPDAAARARLASLLRGASAVGIAALVGLARARSRRPRPFTMGAALGIGVWLAGDELAAPLLGLADKPTAYHPTQHLQALASRVGYGVAATGATWAVRRVLDGHQEVRHG